MQIKADNRLVLEQALSSIREMFGKTGFVVVTATGKRRSLDQNALYWTWCRQVSKIMSDGSDERDVDATCKLMKGFSLRRADDPEFDELMSRTIDKLWPENQRWDLAHSLAKEIHCTSRLPAKAMSAYMEWMQLHWWGALQIRLESK